MTSKPKLKSPEKGTVLLRNAEPKYSFVGKKLPKSKERESRSKQIQHTERRPSDDLPPTTIQNTPTPPVNSSVTKKPVAVVEGSCQSTSYSIINSPMQGMVASTSNPPLGDQKCVDYEHKNVSSHDAKALYVPLKTLSPSDLSLSPSPLQPTISNIPPLVVIENTAAALALSNITNSLSVAERLKEVDKERDQLKMDLQVQLQVNSELKRLLVASVGEDLGERVQRLVRDRAQLSFDIGGFSKKMRDDYEHLDKVSIQADMWRSKYLASRVMIEELGNSRAFFSLQCHDAQDALQQMLNERHELRTNLMDTFKVLQQVKGAFDPLNSHRSSSLPSTNVLDLSRSCQQLSEAVRFRLLPAHITTATSVDNDLDSWENSVTRAEQYAHELLSRPSEPPGSLQSGSSQLLPVTGGPISFKNSPHAQLINRFHPLVRHDNINFTCCKCKGETSVI